MVADEILNESISDECMTEMLGTRLVFTSYSLIVMYNRQKNGYKSARTVFYFLKETQRTPVFAV